MPRQNPCGYLPGRYCMHGSSCIGTSIPARHRAPKTARHSVLTSVFLLGGQRGLNLLHDCLKYLQVEVHAQLQSTRRDEVCRGGKFCHVERVFVAHVWVAPLALHRRVTGQSSSSSRSSSTSNGDSTSPRQASRPSRTASTATTSAATESAHHQPNRLSRTRPMNTAPER